MHKIFAKTLFLGKKVYFLPECHSTNDTALELIAQNKATEGDLIVTERQTGGKGQRGNQWESETGQNITISLILSPRFLAPQDQFSLNLICSLAVHDMLFGILGSHLRVKWPNDIFYKDSKIAGILIENTIRAGKIEYAVMGLGLNVNQVEFNHDKASSLRDITSEQYDLNDLIETFLSKLESRYLLLKQNQYARLVNEYHTRLYRFEEEHMFQQGDRKFLGTIQGIDDLGRLRILTHHGEQSFNFKEVSFL